MNAKAKGKINAPFLTLNTLSSLHHTHCIGHFARASWTNDMSVTCSLALNNRPQASVQCTDYMCLRDSTGQ